MAWVTLKEFMYTIIGITSGIVQAQFTQRGAAEYWVECNGYDEEGNCLDLYKIVKTK